MNFKVFCAGALIGCLYSTALSAGPLYVDPYPAGEAALGPGVAVDDGGGVQALEEVIVSGETPEPFVPLSTRSLLERYPVPQPGDSYFDPPLSDSAAAQAVAESLSSSVAEVDGGDAPVFAGIEEQEVAESLPFGPDYEPAAGNLQVRMSESFDDMLVESEPVGAEEGAATGVVQAEAAPLPKPEEFILWSGPRVVSQPASQEVASEEEVQQVVSEPPVSEVFPVRVAARDSGLVDVHAGATDSADSAGWSAAGGANMRQVLQGWAKREGAGLVWDSGNEFAVLESLEIRGPFHSAVKTLLDQYQDSEVRPVATLHIDPQNGEKTLVVKVLGGA
ncbi:MAG: TcpQ domain-containing protein [Alphaproteobacteria bacterium]